MDTFDHVRALLFDLDGTLRHSYPTANDMMLDYATNLGASNSSEKRRLSARWEHYYWAQSPELLQDIQSYPGMDSEFWINYSRRKLQSIELPAEQVDKLSPLLHQYMADNYQPEDLIIPQTPTLLQSLKDSGYLLGLVTNRTNPIDEYLVEVGLAEYFQAVVVAGQVGTWKPDPAIFQPALERLNSQPEQTIYIGDNYYADVLGARAAGIIPILYDPQGIFPDVDCISISSFDELVNLLG